MLQTRALLATGDYSGRIIIWNLSSGEKRLTLRQHSPSCACTSWRRVCAMQFHTVLVLQSSHSASYIWLVSG